MGVFSKKGNYWIDYYAHGKRKREKIGTSKVLADNVLRKRKIELAEGKFLDIKKDKRIKFEDFTEEYINKHLKINCSQGWVYNETATIEMMKDYFRGKYLYQVKPMMIEEFKAKRLQEVGKVTVNKNLASLRSIFNKAKDWGRFEGDNPVKKVKLLKTDNKRLRYLEKEEIPILINSCVEPLKSIVLVALNTGMRKSELLHLKWVDLDFRRGIVQLLKTKNNKPRHIPMNETVRRTLIAVKKHPDSPYVFVSRCGKPFVDIKRVFKTALGKSGISSFRFHDLRHTFASQLVMSGVDLNTVRDLLGHSSLAMTLRYAHLSPSHRRQAIEILEREIGNLLFSSSDVKNESILLIR